MFYFPTNPDPLNHQARRWLRRIGPETYRRKGSGSPDGGNPREHLVDDIGGEAPMASPFEGEGPTPLWELEQDAQRRDSA